MPLSVCLWLQLYFAFECLDPEIGGSWHGRPQVFKTSPTLSGEALHEDLRVYQKQKPDVSLLKYVDDLLISAIDWETCFTGTECLLQALMYLGYRASVKEA